MQPSEILKQIKPCDLDEPFVFISYSSQDNQRVWADALRFQQMGYNVWLDKKNLDKTKPSWRDDALEAIRDFNCALLVYYVSRSSLVSPACFKELECTVEDTTQAIHNGPVKFIAVDIEPIDDIIKFKNEVHGELVRKKMDKAEKTAMAITLSKCINQFFNSNNEKDRVKAYSLPNREMDYYEEITASFPDETRIYKPKVEKTEPKKETASARPTAPAMKTAKKAPKAFSLEQALADANQELGKDATNQFTAYKDVSEKRISNFRKVAEVPDHLELTGIEALWGFGDGHETEGLVVDQAKLYYGTNLHSTVEYRKVTDVACFSSDDMLIVHCEDSAFGQFVGPTALGAPIKAFLQACIDQRS